MDGAVMEFGWSTQEDVFRDEIRTFIAKHVPQEWFDHPLHRRAAKSDRDKIVAFNGELGANGNLTPGWPAEYGGSGATAWEQAILGEEMWCAGEPRGPQYMNVNWIGPSIMMFGDETQKQYHLGRISKGDVFWCQGFSEPDAGSDLASLKTRAVRDGDEYVVNGQKIWTSHCQLADFCYLLVRTAPDKHHGITILLVPMDTHGLEVRKVPEMVGEGAFHELFFTDMRVPANCRLGDENEGWGIIRRSLQYERVGAPRWEKASRVLDRIAKWAKETGRFDEPAVQRQLGEAKAMVEAARLLAYSVIDERASGKVQGDQAYVARLSMVKAEKHVQDLGFELFGGDALRHGSDIDEGFRSSLTAGVAAGSYEVNLNLVANLVLGLPRK